MTACLFHFDFDDELVEDLISVLEESFRKYSSSLLLARSLHNESLCVSLSKTLERISALIDQLNIQYYNYLNDNNHAVTD